EAVRTLLDRGANVEAEAGACVEKETPLRQAALKEAAWGKHMDIVNELLQHGAKVTKGDIHLSYSSELQNLLTSALEAQSANETAPAVDGSEAIDEASSLHSPVDAADQPAWHA